MGMPYSSGKKHQHWMVPLCYAGLDFMIATMDVTWHRIAASTLDGMQLIAWLMLVTFIFS